MTVESDCTAVDEGVSEIVGVGLVALGSMILVSRLPV